jgi:hypothetical protein
MFSMYEVVAHDRLHRGSSRHADRDLQQLRVAREVAAARRWCRIAQRAHAAQRRHSLRVG